MKLRDKNVFITGASRGIGLAIAKAFAEKGANVLMVARTKEKLELEVKNIIESGGKAWYHQIDVSDDKSVEIAVKAAFDKFENIDILINNAAIAIQGYFLEQDPSIARQEMEVNYFGLLRVCRAIMPSMKERGEGMLITISSVLGRIPYPTHSTYSATKAAIIAFSEALRGELKPYGIKVVLVLPGITDTDMLKNSKVVSPQIQQPEAVAKTVVKAARKSKRQVTSGIMNKFAIAFSRIYPKLTERMMISSANKAMKDEN